MGIENRAVAATGMNAVSSRSHALVHLFVRKVYAGWEVLSLSDLGPQPRPNSWAFISFQSDSPCLMDLMDVLDCIVIPSGVCLQAIAYHKLIGLPVHVVLMNGWGCELIFPGWCTVSCAWQIWRVPSAKCARGPMDRPLRRQSSSTGMTLPSMETYHHILQVITY